MVTKKYQRRKVKKVINTVSKISDFQKGINGEISEEENEKSDEDL
jgi:hypothetical protein